MKCKYCASERETTAKALAQAERLRLILQDISDAYDNNPGITAGTLAYMAKDKLTNHFREMHCIPPNV